MPERAGGDVTDSSTTWMTSPASEEKRRGRQRAETKNLFLEASEIKTLAPLLWSLRGAEDRHKVRQKLVHPLVELVLIRLRPTRERDIRRRAKSDVLQNVHVLDIDFVRIGCREIDRDTLFVCSKNSVWLGTKYVRISGSSEQVKRSGILLILPLASQANARSRPISARTSRNPNDAVSHTWRVCCCASSTARTVCAHFFRGSCTPRIGACTRHVGIHEALAEWRVPLASPKNPATISSSPCSERDLSH